MISVNKGEIAAQLAALEAASETFDSATGSSVPSVQAGDASAVLLDVLATVAQVSLTTVQHVDATSEFARIAVADLASYDSSASDRLRPLFEGLG